MNPALIELPRHARVLIRGVNWLGDAVMTTPALLRLRECLPHAHFTLLTSANLAELWTGHPAVDVVVPFAAGESPWAIGRRLRQHQFDAALVLPNSPRSALEVRLAAVPIRVGYRRPWRNWLLTHPVPARDGEHRMHKRTPAEIRRQVAGGGQRTTFPALAHHLYQYLHLTAQFGASIEPQAPRIFVSPEEIVRLRERFPVRDGTGPLLGLNPGAEYGPAKRWPAQRFGAVAARLVESIGARWWIFGGPKDTKLAEGIATMIREITGTPEVVSVLAGKTSLRELCAGLAGCRVVLTNDTGPMHVAAAVGTPVVVPFGSTAPELTGPGAPHGVGHILLSGAAPCAPCFRRDCPVDSRCLMDITEARVLEAMEQAIAISSRRTR